MNLVGRFFRWLLGSVFMYLPQDCEGLSTARPRVAKIQDVPTTLNGNCSEIGTRNRYAGALWFVSWTISTKVTGRWCNEISI